MLEASWIFLCTKLLGCSSQGRSRCNAVSDLPWGNFLPLLIPDPLQTWPTAATHSNAYIRGGGQLQAYIFCGHDTFGGFVCPESVQVEHMTHPHCVIADFFGARSKITEDPRWLLELHPQMKGKSFYFGVHGFNPSETTREAGLLGRSGADQFLFE